MFDSAEFAENVAPIERRRHRRQRTFLHGKLVFAGNCVTGDCTIRDLSEQGGRLIVRDLDYLPGHPVLIVTKTGMAHDAMTVWKAGREFGVAFKASCNLNSWEPPRLAHAYHWWVESLRP